jgi:hypothetical protein
MVSHAEVAPPPPSSRRASSVASRRHHQSRQGRSHHGGSSYTPQNEFPFFAQTGDVEVVIACGGQEKRYLLHRLILAQFSGFFEAGMRDEWSRHHLLPAPEGRGAGALTVIGEGSDVGTGPSQSTPAILPDVNTRRRWRYELDWSNLEEDEEPMLIQRPPSPTGLFMPTHAHPPPPRIRPPPQQSFFRSMANLSLSHPPPQQIPAPEPVNPLIRDYDNLFRTFYSLPPVLNTTNIASAYSECKALLTLADMYDCLPVVGSRIDHHLLRFGSRLFKQIAKYPPSYLKLGYLARSRVIFSEALTHVVGQWPAAYPYLKPADPNPAPGLDPPLGGGYEVPQSVIDLIEDKYDELEELKSRVEAKLFRLTLTTGRGERVNPSNDYLGWLAMSLFRQWIAENTTPEVRGILKRPGVNDTTQAGGAAAPQPPQAQPPAITPSRIYRLLSSTNPESYLPYDELKRFLKCHPVPSASSRSAPTSLYSKETLKKLDRKMTELKNLARDVVKPLTRNCLELDLRLLSAEGESSGVLGYLTCMKVEEGEIPWD